MKTKNNNNEVVTRGILKETLNEAVDGLMVRIEAKIDTKIDEAIGGLAIMIQNGFMATAKQEDLLALTERMDNYERERKNDHADTLDLKIRVGKLEKKAK